MCTRGGQRWLVAVLVLATVLVACGNDESARPEAHLDTTTTTAAPTTTTLSPQDQAIQVYLASQDLMNRLAGMRVPDALSPEIDMYFSGAAKTEAINVLLNLVNAHEYSQTTTVSNPTVVSGDDTEFLLADCITETYQGYDADTDQPTDSGTVTFSWRIRMVNTPDGWRVDEIIRPDEPC